VVLYGCETWFLTLREEHSRRVLMNRVLRRIFGPKRDEVEPLWRSERLKRYVMAPAHFLSPTYSTPSVWHGFSLHVIFPLPSPRVGLEGRFYCRSLVLSRARETVARVLPASEGTHIEILFWLVFQIAFRRSARWLGKGGGCRRSRRAQTVYSFISSFCMYLFILVCTR
jgi:hypothetical protein